MINSIQDSSFFKNSRNAVRSSLSIAGSLPGIQSVLDFLLRLQIRRKTLSDIVKGILQSTGSIDISSITGNDIPLIRMVNTHVVPKLTIIVSPDIQMDAGDHVSITR